MPRSIVLEEIHLTVVVPASLPTAVCNSACRTLRSRRLLASLRHAIVAVLRRHPSLTRVRFTITR